MYCSNNFTKNEDCVFCLFFFSFVNECKMKNRWCSQVESVNWSLLGAVCKSQQPAAISSSLARGDRAVQWLTQTAQSQNSHRSGIKCNSWFVLLKMYWERHWTCKEDVRSATCPEPHKPWSFSAWWSRQADPGSDSVYKLILEVCFYLYGMIDITLLWPTKLFILFSCPVWPVSPISNCNIGKVVKNKLYYL